MKRWRCHPSLRRWYRGAFLVLVVVLCTGAWPALGAELQLRETLIQAQRDCVTATVTAVVDHIGASALTAPVVRLLESADTGGGRCI